jgi:hypothetical protein
MQKVVYPSFYNSLNRGLKDKTCIFNCQIKKRYSIIFSEINDYMPISETNRRKIDFLCHFDTTCHTKQPLFIYNICQNRIGKLFVVNKNRRKKLKKRFES